MSDEEAAMHVDPEKELEENQQQEGEGEEAGAEEEKATVKVSRRERKKMEKKEKFDAQMEELLSPFSVTVENSKSNEGMRDISLNKVSVSVNGKVLFKDTAVKLSAGSRYGLMGPNGRGKSTILKLLSTRELPVQSHLDILLVEQEQEFTASEVTAVNAVLQSHKKLIAYQKEAAELMEKEGLTPTEMERLHFLEEELNYMGVESSEAKARRILYGLGFPTEWHDRPTKSFSGGWRKRVALASAVFIEPDVLMLDEPTNHLDLNAVIWLESYLAVTYDEKAKRPKTLVVVSHDAGFLDAVCTHMVHVENFKLNYYKGGFSAFESQLTKHHAEVDKKYTEFTKEIRSLKQKGMSRIQIDDWLRDEINAGRKDPSFMERREEYRVNFPFEDPIPLPDACVCKLDDVSFNYPGGPVLFQNVSCALWTDSRITLCGPNGIGKSTLLNLLTGVLEPTSGFTTMNRMVRIGRYNQHFVDKLPLDLTAVQYMNTLGLTEESAARKQLGCFGLESKAHHQVIETLSGGQKARVAFAAISAERPNFILMDEPTNHLDVEAVDALCAAIRNFKGGILVVTHDARLIESTDMTLWIAGNKNVTPFNGDLDDYKEMVRAEFALSEQARLDERARAKEDKVLTKELRADGLTLQEAKKAVVEEQQKKTEEDADDLFGMASKKSKSKKPKDGEKKEKKEKKKKDKDGEDDGK